MRILAIETSCDETAIAILEFKGWRFRILADVISSQVNIHKPFGGVVPNLAAREHEKNLPITLKLALEQSSKEIDYFAVTVGPGLAPALARGVRFAKNLAVDNNKPLIPVSHLQGHLWSNLIKTLHSRWQTLRKLEFPAVALIISGGHTELLLMKNIFNYELLGATLDDAAGEAFDKVARLLGLGYPGGPEIEKLAEKGNPKAINFPRPMLNQKNYDFSFAGLKTSVLYFVRDLEKSYENARFAIALARRAKKYPPRLAVFGEAGESTKKMNADIAASFQQAVIDILIGKTLRAVKEYKAKTVMLSGGVSANQAIVGAFRKSLKPQTTNHKPQTDLFVPSLRLSTDNAVMIGLAAYLQLKQIKKQGKKLPLEAEEIDIQPNLRI